MEGTKYIPEYRFTDCLALAFNGNVIIETTSGFASFDKFKFFSGKHTGSETWHLGVSTEIKSYTEPNLWGLQVNLPNNSFSTGYGNFHIEGSMKVLALSDFNFYVAYGHKLLGGTASIGYSQAGFEFTTNTDMSYSPPLGVLLPA